MVEDTDLSITEFLNQLGQAKAHEIPLAETALRLAALEMPGIVLQRYQHYLVQLGARVRQRHHDLLANGAQDDVYTQIAALKHVLADEDGYVGDEQNYDHPDNANLIRVIDRRRGLPIALGVLYLHAGQKAGLAIEGVNFPGHFLLRLTQAGIRVLIDPFDRCAVLDAAGLRTLLKRTQGSAAELSADYYEVADARMILIRLYNTIKLRQIEGEDYTAALRTVELMRLIDPAEFRLLLDAGVLYAKVGRPQAAVPMLRDYIDRWPVGHPNRLDAQRLLTEISTSFE